MTSQHLYRQVSGGYAHRNMYQLDKITDESHNSKSNRNRAANPNKFYKALSERHGMVFTVATFL
jgi:hypothetical protein